MDVASLSTITPSSISTITSSSVSYKPVFGKGREKRWTDFQEIFRTSLQGIYGDELIVNAETRKDLGYRLIVVVEAYKCEKAIGIVIFSQHLSNSARMKLFGIKNAFHVKAIHLISYPENLWVKLIELAKWCNSSAESVFLCAAKTDVQLAESLERAWFTKLSLVADHYDCYDYRLERKEETEASGTGHSSGKRDRTTVTPSDDVEDNRPPKTITGTVDTEKK